MTTTDQYPLPPEQAADTYAGGHGTDARTGSGSGSGAQTPETQAAWRIVAGREIMVKLRDRNFIISTLTTLGVIIVAFAVSFFVGGQSQSKTLAVVSPESTAIAQQAAAGSPGASGPFAPGDIELTLAEFPDDAAAEQAVSDGDADAALLGAPGDWTLVGTDSVDGAIAGSVGAVIAADALATNAADAGTTVEDLTAGSVVGERLLEPNGGADEGVQYIAGFVFVFLFYMAAILFGYAIANSVVEEKQSRIVEILATAIPLRQLLVGKVLGNAALAMGQLVLFVGVALVGVSFTDSGAMLPGLLGPSAWFLVFFAVGFVALACVWAVCGSLASRTEDLQATTMPMTMLLVGLLLLGLMGSGTTQVIASYVPIASVVTMPARLLAGTAAWWEPVLSLALTLAAAAALIAIAERIYRRSLLQTGGRLSLRQALRVQE